ncbi:isocitrate/isopropylmalate dehydrogenase family protein [bacterium]|nr:isocitrate/isopropylmalate dehydrogenase family protein [bacterium]
MSKYKIAWLPGDGIGNEVMEAARLVLDSLGLDAEYIHGDIGWEFWKTEGDPLPKRTTDMMEKTDCALFGAITSKPQKEAKLELAPELQGKNLTYFSPIVRLRQEFDLYCNERPNLAFKGSNLNLKDDIDITVFRENTEGSYAGVEFGPTSRTLREHMLAEAPKMQRFMDMPDDDIAISTRIITRKGAERIIRSAFEHAKKFGKKSVTLVEKPNVLRKTGGLMVDVFDKVASEYPEIQSWFDNVDAIAMWLVKSPEKYDVLVAENLFGDIISDLAGQLVGGLGFAHSGNTGNDYAVFEPVHGSAPKYAGMYKVNPFAMLLATRMMLNFLGEKEMAAKLYKGIEKTITDAKVLTYDMGGAAKTLDVAHEVIKNFE